MEMLRLGWVDAVLLAGYFAAMFGVGCTRPARSGTSMTTTWGAAFRQADDDHVCVRGGTHADFAVGVASQSYKLGMAGSGTSGSRSSTRRCTGC